MKTFPVVAKIFVVDEDDLLLGELFLRMEGVLAQDGVKKEEMMRDNRLTNRILLKATYHAPQ